MSVFIDALNSNASILLTASEASFMSAVILKILVNIVFFARQVIEGRKLTKISAFYGDEFNRLEKRLNFLANMLGIAGGVGLLIYYRD